MINQQEFARRRQALFERMPDNSIAILPAGPEVWRSADAYYDFYQDNDFYYMTGFPEPEAVAVLIKEKNDTRYLLFNRVKDLNIERWVGYFAGQEGAVELYGADESYPIAEFKERLPKLLLNKEAIFYTWGRYQAFDDELKLVLNALRSKVRLGIRIPDTACNLENVIFEMRLIKSETEIAMLRKANQISMGAHERVMQLCKPGMNEQRLESEFVYDFLREGCSMCSYKSIVAGGASACVLHYIENNRDLKDGDLVLIDAGGRYESYCADITRTFPVNGKFSAEQKALYEIVLEAQLASIAEVKPGNSWINMSDVATRKLTEGLVDVGLLQGRVDDLIEAKSYETFYYHRIGHWLGMDTHDVGRYKTNGQWRNFEPGMVTTVEPGIYVRPGTEGVDEKWWGIGIRIEDNILVTDAGHENFTNDLLKTVDDIETLMK